MSKPQFSNWVYENFRRMNFKMDITILRFEVLPIRSNFLFNRFYGKYVFFVVWLVFFVIIYIDNSILIRGSNRFRDQNTRPLWKKRLNKLIKSLNITIKYNLQHKPLHIDYSNPPKNFNIDNSNNTLHVKSK